MTNVQEIVVTLVSKKLGRVIKYIAENGGRPLRPEQQHAIRILESRKRMWRREFLARYGVGQAHARAVIELQKIKSQDNGDLLEFNGSKHGVGRLDCTACDFAYTDYGGFPMQESMAQVCPKCSSGVFHVKTIGRWPEGTVIDPVTRTSEKEPVYWRHFICDHCGYTADVLAPVEESAE